MKVLFDEITGNNHRYCITDSHWFPLSGEWSIVAAKAMLLISRQNLETVLVQGEIRGEMRLVCDRCGEPFKESLQSEFTYKATTRKEDVSGLLDLECSDEDAVLLYLPGPMIEIDDLLREQTLLAVPMKNLCREDCRGICAGCGLVLNQESCRCKPDESDSPFAVLKKLKTQ